MGRRFSLMVIILQGCTGGDSQGDDSVTGEAETSASSAATTTEADASSGPGAVCPADAPEGTEPGQVVPTVDVAQCDGTLVSLHDLVCGHPITLLDIGSAAFQECVDATDAYASSAEYAELKDRGLQIVQTFVQDDAGQTPTKTFCDTYSEEHNIDFVFTIDQVGSTVALTETGPYNLVLDDQAHVLHVWEGEIPADKIEILSQLLGGV